MNSTTNGVEVEAASIGGTLSAGQSARTAEINELPSSDSDDNNPEDGDNHKEERGISLQELIYGASSFHAVVKPVSVTMILAALAVIYINTDETKAAGALALDQTYQVFSISEEQNAATSLGLGLVNALVIVCVIGVMTFLLVLLYKYRCMKVLIGYMVFASTMLLGFLGGQMFIVAINKYKLTIDQISFYVTMYNFAIVGCVAIFYQKGIPTYVNQAYLVATSVIVGWQLSYFNAWMAWALLIMLAFYDLCAVLTPCGPLKALVNLMSKDDAPSMPGLLYEARLPENATRPGAQPKRDNGNVRNESTVNESRTEAQQNTEIRNSANEPEDYARENDTEANAVTESNEAETREKHSDSNEASLANSKKISSSHHDETPEGVASSQSNHHRVQSESGASMPATSTPRTTTLPLAIAKIYKLPIASPDSLSISLDSSSPTAYLQQQFSAPELQTDVEVKLPRNGGRIETARNKKGELRYVVKGREGEVKRTLLVDENGKVLEIVPRGDDDYKEDNTIKLGLGDFIFYSVLVSKAAENGFAAFVACFMCILTGLGGTLVLLAVYHHALPALPISIFLAVIMFVLTIYCMEPWIEDMWRGPYYV